MPSDERLQQALANNLPNSETPGFKSTTGELLAFQEQLQQMNELWTKWQHNHGGEDRHGRRIPGGCPTVHPGTVAGLWSQLGRGDCRQYAGRCL